MVDDAILALTRKYPELLVKEDRATDYVTFSVRSHDGKNHTWDMDRSYLMQLPTHIIFTQILSWLHRVGYTDSNGNPMGRNLVFKTPPFMQEQAQFMQQYGSPAFKVEYTMEYVDGVAFKTPVAEKKKPVRMGKWGVKLD